MEEATRKKTHVHSIKRRGGNPEEAKLGEHPAPPLGRPLNLQSTFFNLLMTPAKFPVHMTSSCRPVFRKDNKFVIRRELRRTDHRLFRIGFGKYYVLAGPIRIHDEDGF